MQCKDGILLLSHYIDKYGSGESNRMGGEKWENTLTLKWAMHLIDSNWDYVSQPVEEEEVATFVVHTGITQWQPKDNDGSYVVH